MMKELDRLISIMKALRDPENGCPWDKEQTIQSIKGFTIEEMYEVVDAIERDDMDDLCDELGDLLFHIVFYSEMANEQRHFCFEDVVNRVGDKLERRHPHVFSDQKVETSVEVKELWEQLKQEERKNNASSSNARTYLLDDISKHIPAAQRAMKLQKRAASVGFDWTESIEILDKIEEEVSELRSAIHAQEKPENIAGELGDLLFCCINLARKYRIDPELALRNTNEKFINRFNHIEAELRKKDKSLEEALLEEMDALWDDAKLKSI